MRRLVGLVIWIGLVAVGCAGAAPVQPAQEAALRVAALYEAWEAEDGEAVLSFLADDVRAYDANAGFMGSGSAALGRMLRDTAWWDRWDLDVGSFFVSADGGFAAVLSTFTVRSRGPQPAVSLLAFHDGKVTWQCDYYGGETDSNRTDTLVFPPEVNEPPADAEAVMAAARTTLDAWAEAYNARDTAPFVAAYADDATFVDLVSPERRELSRAELAGDIATRFADPAFRSRLEPSDSSPIDRYFLSADGRFAAAQGTFLEGPMSEGHPMAIILELDQGQIVGQYNFIGVRWPS